MQYLIPGIFLFIIFSFFSSALQTRLRKFVHHRPKAVFAPPAGLTAFFCLLCWRLDTLSPQLALLVAVYTFLPSLIAWRQGPGGGRPTSLDFAAILLLWLPLEFSLGKDLIPREAQGFLHTVIYGVAITLSLWLFLIFREWTGMKVSLPRGGRDFLNPLIGFVLVAPVLILVGLQVGFIQPFHVPDPLSGFRIATRFLVILAATAIPEEILFRALIQNGLTQRFGSGNKVIFLAALIFGCSHLNNGPIPPLNWPYMLLATAAGFAFGKVFQKSSTLLSSALLHATVNSTKYFFF